mmetsp:Transcript_15189/g.38604  ORF Transcript_15189/g.38604 Transcript_15189/m.38604 type:complete len:415 (-) Transcript_15189:1648-2892(-)
MPAPRHRALQSGGCGQVLAAFGFRRRESCALRRRRRLLATRHRQRRRRLLRRRRILRWRRWQRRRAAAADEVAGRWAGLRVVRGGVAGRAAGGAPPQRAPRRRGRRGRRGEPRGGRRGARPQRQLRRPCRRRGRRQDGDAEPPDADPLGKRDGRQRRAEALRGPGAARGAAAAAAVAGGEPHHPRRSLAGRPPSRPEAAHLPGLALELPDGRWRPGSVRGLARQKEGGGRKRELEVGQARCLMELPGQHGRRGHGRRSCCSPRGGGFRPGPSRPLLQQPQGRGVCRSRRRPARQPHALRPAPRGQRRLRRRQRLRRGEHGFEQQRSPAEPPRESGEVVGAGQRHPAEADLPRLLRGARSHPRRLPSRRRGRLRHRRALRARRHDARPRPRHLAGGGRGPRREGGQRRKRLSGHR